MRASFQTLSLCRKRKVQNLGLKMTPGCIRLMETSLMMLLVAQSVQRTRRAEDYATERMI